MSTTSETEPAQRPVSAHVVESEACSSPRGNGLLALPALALGVVATLLVDVLVSLL